MTEQINYFARFMRLLPQSVKDPEVWADREGVIYMQWSTRRRRCRTVEIDESTDRPCVAIYSSKEGEIAREPFDGKSIPAEILNALQGLNND